MDPITFRDVRMMTIPELVEAVAINSDLGTFCKHKHDESDEQAEQNLAEAMRYYDRRAICMREINRRAGTL